MADIKLDIPTTREIAQSLEARMAPAELPKSFAAVTSKVYAGATNLLYRYGAWLARQMFVAHAAADPSNIGGRQITPLVEWGRLVGVGPPKPAVPTRLSLALFVHPGAQGRLPAGLQFVHDATGLVYSLESDVEAESWPNVVAVAVAAGGRHDVDLPYGTRLSVIDYSASVQELILRVVTVAQLHPGVPPESPEAYRARVLRRWRSTPQGGALEDYRRWAEEIEGVQNAYPYTSTIPGVVEVYCEFPESIQAPSRELEALEAAVQAAIDAQRPANARVRVSGLARYAIDVTLHGLEVRGIAARTSLVRDIAAALDERLRSMEPYILGLSGPERNDRIDVIELLSIAHVVCRAAGTRLASLTAQFATRSGDPPDELIVPRGGKLQLGELRTE